MSQAAAVTVVPLALAAFWAYCLVDFTRTDERDMRTFDRRTWVVLLVVTTFLGAVLWYVKGRPRNAARR